MPEDLRSQSNEIFDHKVQGLENHEHKVKTLVQRLELEDK